MRVGIPQEAGALEQNTAGLDNAQVAEEVALVGAFEALLVRLGYLLLGEGV